MTRDRDAWYRRTTWTQSDQEDFFARNKRSRGDRSKAQYMRIQAHTLFETGKPELVQAALMLAERACSEYPNAFDRAGTLEIAGQCCEALGRTDHAIEFYRCAVQREREFRGVRGNAGFRLAKVIVENDRRDLFDEAIGTAECQGAPVFPWHAYILNGVRAIVASHAGEEAKARSLANAALKAAAVRDTGLSHGRGHLGTVRDTHTVFHKMLLDISDD